MSELNSHFSLDAIVEIPKGSRNKYEYDYEKKMIRYDRMLFSPMHYPTDYGYFPETLAGDGDPLDALVLVSEPTFPGCLIEVRPIALFRMHDEKGPDSKILCVPVSDPIWNKLYRLSEVNPHLIKEIEHFFAVYKDLEKKKVGIEGWEDEDAAVASIRRSQQRFLDKQQ
ncbi:inorganic pyrophosphatase [Flexibacter flexilis DSM 6793]|uniref:Inorganic pyrophosphatase n=1 Tax=Flexibacter flexilis DSM 6793 TaxID=927664 RepID=A0A1I1LPB4_9BACT|nr:inorganic diphosphatase [Flexibacter flexilis]SFC74911.1 inorganic pyrophosphatase [Flexibacter flexilis DSM 6793]